MKLYFICPVKNELFGSEDYSLDAHHRIQATETGGRELQGIVTLSYGCPLCGQLHQYKVKDVMCSLDRGKK